MDSTPASTEDERVGRRAGSDRRVSEEPIVHSERRKKQRRSGSDRRTADRL
ncbi:hypothetical protein [Tsuneonella sp. HG222]